MEKEVFFPRYVQCLKVYKHYIHCLNPKGLLNNVRLNGLTETEQQFKILWSVSEYSDKYSYISVSHVYTKLKNSKVKKTYQILNRINNEKISNSYKIKKKIWDKQYSRIYLNSVLSSKDSGSSEWVVKLSFLSIIYSSDTIFQIIG